MNRAASLALFGEQTRHFEGDLLNVRNWSIFSRIFPDLDVGFEGAGRTPFRVRMNCEDWNGLPPSITLLSFSGDALSAPPTGGPGIFHQGPHPNTGRPFVCMAGAREYHTHPSHISDVWDNYRVATGYDLGGILTRIWNGWLKSAP